MQRIIFNFEEQEDNDLPDENEPVLCTCTCDFDIEMAKSIIASQISLESIFIILSDE